MNTNNFLTARTLRRDITRFLQEQQRRDSACSEQLRLVISRHTRTILNIISELLLSFTKTNLTDQDRSLFATVTQSSLTVESWLQSRALEADAAAKVAAIEANMDSADAEYSRIAPFGTVTSWVSNQQEKVQIKSAKATRDRVRREYENAKSGHEAKLATVQSNAEHFLRRAMSYDGIAVLLQGSPVRTKLKAALDAMNKEINDLWLDHTRKQTVSLETVSSATSQLLAMYRWDNPSTKPPLLGAGHAGTRH